MQASWAVEAVGVEKSYGAVQVLKGIDLQIAAGSVFALLGPNGAGKTTMVRILSTLAAADAGRANVMGLDVVQQRREVRRLISLTGQFAAVDEGQTGVENLRMMGRLTGLPRRVAASRAIELLDRFDLSEAGGRRVSTYSGGMRRRLDLAAGLVGRPSVVFLDEPTTGLDPRSRQAMWEVIGELVGDGVTIFLTTQYLEEADRLADQIAVIDGGVVVAAGTARELKKQVAEQRLDCFVRPDSFEAVVQAAGDSVVADAARSLVSMPTDGSAAQIRWLLNTLDPDGDRIETFTVHSATLDDVFLALTGRSTSVAGSCGSTAPVSAEPGSTAPASIEPTSIEPASVGATHV